jgi:large subunit ribosomal protein L25
MDELTLTVNRRDVLGKKNRFLRNQGFTPVHLFGHDIESRALQCDTTQLRQIVAVAGATRLINLKIEGEKDAKRVFIREIQKDVFGKKLLHVDFYQVKKGQKIAFVVPIVLVGEAPAMKGKGRMLIHGVTRIRLECLPENVPARVEVDISGLLEIGQSISVKDIVLDPSITIKAEPEQLVVRVVEAIMKEKVEEVAVAAEAVAEGAEGAAVAEKPEGEAAEAKKEEK